MEIIELMDIYVKNYNSTNIYVHTNEKTIKIVYSDYLKSRIIIHGFGNIGVAVYSYSEILNIPEFCSLHDSDLISDDIIFANFINLINTEHKFGCEFKSALEKEILNGNY